MVNAWFEVADGDTRMCRIPMGFELRQAPGDASIPLARGFAANDSPIREPKGKIS